MLRFLLIFFTLAAVLLGILLFQKGRMNPSYFAEPRRVLSPGEKVSSISNDKVRFSISPQPVRAMKPLRFEVIVQNGVNPNSVMVDLSMPDMYMGLNQVAMKKSAPNVYEGVGIIPICPSGLKMWQASVIIDNQVAGDFFFNVQY